MRNQEFNPNPSEFTQLYNSLGSSRKVAEHYNVSKTTILSFAKSINYSKQDKPYRYEDLEGLSVGMLTVSSIVERRNSDIYWLCKCECGNEKFIRADSLKRGITNSCGKCLYKTHGKSETRIYRIFRGMRYRCEDDSKKSYKHVEVCSQWTGKNGFENFYDWAMDNGYSDDLTIDRVNVYGNYEPSNCRWITHKEQQNNKTNNRNLDYNGVVKTASEWAEFYNVKSWVIFYLYKKYKEKAIYHIDEFVS